MSTPRYNVNACGRRAVLGAAWIIIAAISLGTDGGEPVTRLSLSNIVSPDGTIRFSGIGGRTCGGWQLALDPGLRARFVDTDGPQESCPGSKVRRSSSYWDDELVVGDANFHIRTMAANQIETYVSGRFQLGALDTAVSGILRWHATTGEWNVVSSSTRSVDAVKLQ